jgi:hypothetical protein
VAQQRYLVPGGYRMLGAAVQVLVAMLRRDLVGRHVAKDCLELFELLRLIGPRVRGALERQDLGSIPINDFAQVMAAPLPARRTYEVNFA